MEQFIGVKECILFMTVAVAAAAGKHVRLRNNADTAAYTRLVGYGLVDVAVDAKRGCFVYDVTSTGVTALNKFRNVLNEGEGA